MPIPAYVEEPIVKHNAFLRMEPEAVELPTFEGSRHILPSPMWEGAQAAIDCYWKVWEIAFRNLGRPRPGTGFVSNFIDTAFNGCIFMWDSAFILMFGRYGRRAFDFQRTLDNFYARQHPDGFISREISFDTGEERFERFNPVSTGPNVLPWCEWEYYLNFGDRDRLGRVFAPLVGYYRWTRRYRSWPDGSYWSTGWGCGMDNLPRVGPGEHRAFSPCHMSWIDATLQAVFSARLLLRMAGDQGQIDEVADIADEAARLERYVDEFMWDESEGFYRDRLRDGTLLDVKHAGAFWALLAGVGGPERAKRLAAHLEDPREFDRPHRVPALSADHPDYDASGGYWRGGVWPPTNYMVLRGLTSRGIDGLAHAIGMNHVRNVTAVFEKTGTVHENYAPESASPGSPAKGDFVGWSGIGPVAVLFEYVFGLRPDVPAGRLVWDVRLAEAHGVERYPFGAKGLVDLSVARRASASEKPAVTARSNAPITLEVRWQGGSETMEVGPA